MLLVGDSRGTRAAIASTHPPSSLPSLPLEWGGGSPSSSSAFTEAGDGRVSLDPVEGGGCTGSRDWQDGEGACSLVDISEAQPSAGGPSVWAPLVDTLLGCGVYGDGLIGDWPCGAGV